MYAPKQLTDQSQFLWSKGTILHILSRKFSRGGRGKRTSRKFGGGSTSCGLSCVAARSHRASFYVPWAADVWKRQHEMLQLQKRLDDAMCAKEEEWCHDLEEPVTGITKQRVHLIPPKLRLIPINQPTLPRMC